MANEDVSRGAAAAPLDPIDAEIARLEAEIAAGIRGNELDVDDDETTEADTTDDVDPEDDEFEDDEDTDEVNTPENDEDDDEDSMLERQQNPKNRKPATPAKKARGDKDGAQDDDDLSNLSRKKRGKLIEDLRREIEEADASRKALEAELAQSRKAEEELEAEVNRALGTDAEYEQANDDGLAGDETAAEKARIWKANRAFFGKLKNKAKQETEKEFTEMYWKDIQGLNGVDPKIVSGKPLSTILRHLYDAGASSVQGDSQAAIEKLQKEVDTWKGRYRALKPKSGSERRSPVGGGGNTVEPGTFDWKAKYLDRKTGLMSDEFDRLVDLYGTEAVITNKIPKQAR